MRTFIVVLCLALGCVIAPLRTAFRDSEEEFLSRVHTLCANAVRADFELREGERKLRQIEDFIARALREGGLTLIPSHRVGEIEGRVAADFGGVYDVHTGRAIESRQRDLARATGEALREAFACDARLDAEVRMVSARWSDSIVVWDGHKAPLSDGVQMVGVIPAISLSIAIPDPMGGDLYFRAAGIQLAFDFEFGNWRFEFTRLDPERFLAEPVRNMGAVVRALGPLAGNRVHAIDACIKSTKWGTSNKRRLCENRVLDDLVSEVAGASAD